MKRRTTIIALVFFLLLGWGGWWLLTHADAPRYRKINGPVALPAGQWTHLWEYPHLLEQGKVWLGVISNPEEVRYYLFDLKTRKVEGELTGAKPAFMNAEQTRLLCVQPDFSGSPLRDKVSLLLERWSSGKILISRSGNQTQRPSIYVPTRYWMLDLTRNTARPLGYAQSMQSRVESSPTGRYAYTRLSATNHLILDLHESTLKIERFGIQVFGWWDDTRLLVKPNIAESDLVLVDVATGEKTVLQRRAELNDQIASHGLEKTILSRVESVWNADHYDFYASDVRDREIRASMAKVTRPNGQLQVLARDLSHGAFGFGRVDSTGTYYVYSPRDQYGAVVLRDLRSGQEHTLAADDGNRNISFPIFWNEGVLYRQSNALWHINLIGTEKVQLFP